MSAKTLNDFEKDAARSRDRRLAAQEQADALAHTTAKLTRAIDDLEAEIDSLTHERNQLLNALSPFANAMRDAIDQTLDGNLEPFAPISAFQDALRVFKGC